MAEQVIVRHSEEGAPIWMLGGVYEVKAASDETGGALTVMHITIPPGAGPPPHTHPGGESVYVLEGTINYHINGEAHQGRAGSFFYLPAGTVENFEPTGDSPVRLLVFYGPGGIDKFFEEAGQPADTHELPPPADEPPDLARVAEIGARYGMDIQAPE